MSFKNKYERRQRTEFWKKYENNQKVTDESQQSQASITEMAKKYGIEALEMKAMKTNIEASELQNRLYGNDLTKSFNSREELLKTKMKLNKEFEKLPAVLRKQLFNDNVVEFVNAYTSEDLNKLEVMKNHGIISETQLNNVKTYINNKELARKEELNRKQFIDRLETMKEGLYENYKATGTITLNNLQGDTTNNKTV